MSLDIFIKLVGTLIDALVWPPLVIIAVFIAFEFNSLAARIVQKRMAKKIDADMREDDIMNNEEECL